MLHACGLELHAHLQHALALMLEPQGLRTASGTDLESKDPEAPGLL